LTYAKLILDIDEMEKASMDLSLIRAKKMSVTEATKALKRAHEHLAYTKEQLDSEVASARNKGASISAIARAMGTTNTRTAKKAIERGGGNMEPEFGTENEGGF
jgi:prefoldin subunit 5